MHIEEVNHTVLVHMTEKMGYKHSEVLSAVLCNRACHTLAVYYLLKKKLKRLSTEYRVSMTAANYRCIPESQVPRPVTCNQKKQSVCLCTVCFLEDSCDHKTELYNRYVPF